MKNKEIEVILRLKDRMTKQLKGVSGKLRHFGQTLKEHWLAISASITAAVIAISKAWDLAQMGAKAKQIEASFKSMAESVGVSASKMRDEIMKAAAGTVNFSNVADKVSALLAQGLNMQTITALMRQARAEAKIFGTTTEQAFTVISSAVTGGLVTTLRRAYGLQLSLKDAADDYAKATGKTAEEVKKYYMAQALANHILQASKSHLKAANLEIMTEYEQMQKLRAEWVGFQEDVGKIFLKSFTFIKGVFYLLDTGFAQLMEWLSAALAAIIKLQYKLAQGLEKILSVIPKIGSKFKGLADGMKQNIEVVENWRDTWRATGEELAKVSWESFDLVFAKTQEGSKSQAEILRDVYQSAPQAAQEVHKSFSAMQEFAKQSARNIQSAFSNFFFRAFTGQLRSIKAVFADFGRAMLQMISNILAKIVLMRMAMAFTGSSGKIFGIPVASLFHAGGLVRKHTGGIIRAHSGMYLAPDEVPIIAQTGEGVISRRGMQVLGRQGLDDLNRGNLPAKEASSVHITIQAIDSQSFSQHLAKHRREIGDLIAEAIYRNAPIRGVIKQYG